MTEPRYPYVHVDVPKDESEDVSYELWELGAQGVEERDEGTLVRAGDGRDDAFAAFVKDHAWGHHASCSNPMGPADDPNAVVDSDFRVIGVQNLRIVDASVFPRIPGFFIVTPIYMIAEKASDVILADAR